MVLELKDKLAKGFALGGDTHGVTGAVTPTVTALQTDAVHALQALGFSNAEALHALQGMDLTGMTVEDVIRTCLRRMGDYA